jgi:hypothetical protein
VKSNNKKNQSFTKKISELPEIIRVPKKKKKEVTPNHHENKENEVPSEKSPTNLHTEAKEEKKNSSEVHSNSPERKNKIDNYDNIHISPKKQAEKIVNENEEEKQNNYEEKKPKQKKIKNQEPTNLAVENSGQASNRHQSLDSSQNDINSEKDRKSQLPTIKGHNSKNDYEYQHKIENNSISKKERKYNHSLEK